MSKPKFKFKEFSARVNPKITMVSLTRMEKKTTTANGFLPGQRVQSLDGRVQGRVVDRVHHNEGWFWMDNVVIAGRPEEPYREFNDITPKYTVIEDL